MKTREIVLYVAIVLLFFISILFFLIGKKGLQSERQEKQEVIKRLDATEKKLVDVQLKIRELGIDQDSIYSASNYKKFSSEILQSPISRIPFALELLCYSFDVCIVDPAKNNIEFYWRDENNLPLKSFSSLKKMLGREKRKMVFGMNAGMFTENNSPLGLYVEDGKELNPINLDSIQHGNFFLSPNGVFFINEENEACVMPSHQYESLGIRPSFATQSGPMLVISGQIHPAFNKGSTNENIRNGVGVMEGGKVVFIISNDPINFYDFAVLFRDYFGCKNALYLDGVISKMYLPELNRTELDGNFGPIIGIFETN